MQWSDFAQLTQNSTPSHNLLFYTYFLQKMLKMALSQQISNLSRICPGFIRFLYLRTSNLTVYNVCANILILQDAEDLSFKKNDILVVVEQNEEKWWTAMDEHGNKGLIPEPYVKKVGIAVDNGKK